MRRSVFDREIVQQHFASYIIISLASRYGLPVFLLIGVDNLSVDIHPIHVILIRI